MHKLLVTLSILFFTACSSNTPLEGAPENGSYGYSELVTGKGLYTVRVDGKTSEKYDSLRVKLVLRASNICEGSFKLSEYTKKQGFVIHAKRVHWPYVTATLECTQDVIDESVLFCSDT